MGTIEGAKCLGYDNLGKLEPGYLADIILIDQSGFHWHPRFDSISCLIGIAVFLGYTAYDTQRIRAFYHYYAGYPDMLEKASIFAALQLYLDFVNLFLYLLRFLGRRRD
mgnify:CR=1 FL=1